MATLDTLQDSVNSLTSSTTTLVNEVQTKKATLDASVADAESAQTGAQSARDTASAHKLAAEAAATSATNTASALTGFDLSAIDDTITDTAVDVFVYDTSKDSDGGAWRKRTQGTSWYNETLNTSTRGSRKEFPAVAVLVLESDTLTIYDGDDPDVPMWMVFNMNGGPSWTNSKMLWSQDGHTSVQALNGTIVTTNDGNSGMQTAEFITDQGYIGGTSATLNGFYGGNIEQRNDSLGVLGGAPRTHYLIVSNNANDVAMTVLPNAPIDAATGLPVPTIAVATNGGVSVITDSGAVYDSAYTDGIAVVAFDEDNGVWYNRNTSYHALSYASLQDWTSGDGFGDVVASTNINVSSFNLLTRGTSSGFGVYGSTLFSGAISATGTHLKKLHLHDINYEDQSKGLDAAISTEYNTGWMNGDIKLATLSDTDDTDVVGSELVTNGTFASDSDWTKGTGWTIGSGVATHAAGTQSYITNTGTNPVAGKSYVYEITVSGLTTSTFTPNIGGVSGTAISANGTYSGTIVATATTNPRVLAGTAADGSIDDFTVRLAEEDRSVNDNGLQVFGTVTKNPVATGADLVGYTFSGADSLFHPYNSGLNVGTGDFCYMTWFKGGSSVNVDHIFERLTLSLGVGDRQRVFLSGTGNLNIAFSGYSTFTSSTSYEGGSWTHLAIVRTANSFNIYLDGKLVGSQAASAHNYTAEHALNVGNRYIDDASSNYAWSGQLALFRFSATAPSAEQIAKIYNDEKVLFQENAQATLYGSSDAVTALAYDDTTGLLHAGTSAGRSVFQGLRRVENTTDAVGTAISASNGLVAEE